MISEILMATHNQGKVEELRKLLSQLPVDVLTLQDFPDLTLPAEDGESFEDNAMLKARFAAQATGLWSLADDSGLEVDALGGRPGVHSARFAGEPADDERNNSKLVELLAGVPPEKRTARFVCAIVIASPEGKLLTARGVCQGIILLAGRGRGGFGYDPLFYVPSLGKTLAEMTLEEKNQISHRGLALREAVKTLAPLIYRGNSW